MSVSMDARFEACGSWSWSPGSSGPTTAGRRKRTQSPWPHRAPKPSSPAPLSPSLINSTTRRLLVESPVVATAGQNQSRRFSSRRTPLEAGRSLIPHLRANPHATRVVAISSRHRRGRPAAERATHARAPLRSIDSPAAETALALSPLATKKDPRQSFASSLRQARRHRRVLFPTF